MAVLSLLSRIFQKFLTMTHILKVHFILLSNAHIHIHFYSIYIYFKVFLKQLKKKDVVHIYNRILAIKKHEMPFVATWMDPDMIIWSQTKKDKYYMTSLISGIYKNDANTYLQTLRYRKNLRLPKKTAGLGAGGELNRKFGININTLLYIK